MTKVLFQATNVITAELKEYCHCKNVNLAILLLEKYHEYLDVFFKQKADTLPVYYLYNHAMKIKEGYQPPSTVIYRMS